MITADVVQLHFGGDKTVTSGTFTIQFPAADCRQRNRSDSIGSKSLWLTLGTNPEPPGVKIVMDFKLKLTFSYRSINYIYIGSLDLSMKRLGSDDGGIW